MRYRALIIEESNAVRHQYAQALLQTQLANGPTFQIVTVSSIAAGQLQATRQEFDLMIAPLHSDGEGLAFVQRLSEINPALRFVLVRYPGVADNLAERVTRLGAVLIDYVSAPQQLASAVLRAVTPQPKVEPAAAPVRNNTNRHLSRTQVQQLQELLTVLGTQGGTRFVLIADTTGQDIAKWSGNAVIDAANVAVLAAGDFLATIELSQLLGGRRACNAIIQEHDEQTILLTRIDQRYFVMLAVNRDMPLGWARIELKRIASAAQAIIARPAEETPKISATFVDDFSTLLDSTWGA